MTIPEHSINSVDDLASWRNVAPYKRDETHHQERFNKVGVLSGNRVDWLHLSHIRNFVFVKDDFLEWNRNSEERRKCLLSVVSEFPAFFAFIGSSHSVALLGCHNCFLEHLVKNIIIFDPNGGCSFDEGENNLNRGDFSLIHELYQLKCMRIFDDLFGLGRNVLEIRFEFVVFTSYSLIELISDEFCLTIGLSFLI